jgi:hypothetical protein
MGQKNPDDGTIVSRSDLTHPRKALRANAKGNALAGGIDHAKGSPAAPPFSENEMPFAPNFHATKVLKP